MANFAVAATDEVIARGNELLEKLMEPGEKKVDALAKIFSLAEGVIDSNRLREQGLDVEGLDAAFMHIRSLFLALASAKEEIRLNYDRNIDELRNLKDKNELELHMQLDTAVAEKKEAEKAAEECKKGQIQAEKEAAALREQLEMSNRLLDEKARIAEMLTSKLTDAEKRAADYPVVNKTMQEQKEQIKEMELRIASIEKDHEFALKKKEMEYALATERAVMEKERSCTDQLRSIEKENSKLSATIEQLEKRIHELMNSQEKDIQQ